MADTSWHMSEESREALRDHLEAALDRSSDDDARYHLRQAMQLIEIEE